MSRDFVTHLECAYTGEIIEKGVPHTLSSAGKPILVRYDLAAMREEVTREDIETSEEAGFWRYSPLLPVADAANRVSLGEVVTPIVALERSIEHMALDGAEVLVKDESRLPTGSFKARGLALAVSMAKEFGFDHLAMPTNGTAASALAASSARAVRLRTGLCPYDTPVTRIP